MICVNEWDSVSETDFDRLDEATESVEVGKADSYYKWVDPLDGHRRPRKGAESPDIAHFKLYEVFKGYGVWRSYSRLSKLYADPRSFNEVIDRYQEIRSEDPSDGKYRDLARAVADENDLDFEYEKTEFGHHVRVWDDEGVEWTFPIKRGEHKERGYSKDYFDALDVEDLESTEYMSYSDIKDSNVESLDEVREKLDNME